MQNYKNLHDTTLLFFESDTALLLPPIINSCRRFSKGVRVTSFCFPTVIVTSLVETKGNEAQTTNIGHRT